MICGCPYGPVFTVLKHCENALQRSSFQSLVPGTCDEEQDDIQDEMKGQIVTEGFDEFYYANNSD